MEAPLAPTRPAPAPHVPGPPLASGVGAALKPVLARLAAGAHLSTIEAEAAFALVLDGQATESQIAALLMALRTRGETVEELAGALRALRSRMHSLPCPEGTIDVCGTGGDGLCTLNVSTAVAFVAAGAGIPVAKHGNRAASSRSGGADVLAALGVKLDPPTTRLPAILREAGVVFLFAPRHHPGLAHAAPARAALGIRTLFNLLGPLANPAQVRRQLVGVAAPAWCRPVAEALALTGCAHAWVVHGAGMDELSLEGPNHIVEARGPVLRALTLNAADLNLEPAPTTLLRGGDPAENAATLLALLANEAGTPALRAYRDTVLLNAAAALVIAGRADDLSQTLSIARASLAEGAAMAALQRLRTASEHS